MGLAPAIRSARRAAPAALAAATIGVILGIAGCSSSGAGQDGSAGGASGGSNAAAGAKGGRYDPMNGKYPVVQWMVNVWEADKPLGSQTGPSQTVVAEPQLVLVSRGGFTTGLEQEAAGAPNVRLVSPADLVA